MGRFSRIKIRICNHKKALKQLASMKDPAEIAGVSTARVSWVLVDKLYVREGAWDNVPAVVEELNYGPNRVACSMRAHKSNTNGLIFSDIQNHFYTLIILAVKEAV